jgi:hypothetical protein
VKRPQARSERVKDPCVEEIPIHVREESLVLQKVIDVLHRERQPEAVMMAPKARRGGGVAGGVRTNPTPNRRQRIDHHC